MQTHIKSPKSKGFLQNVVDYFQSEHVHLYAAILGIALQPISPATGNIGFGIALGITLFRFPLLIQSWCKLFEQIWFRFLAAWLAWSFLSLFWSSDWAFGLLQFKATRVLLWIPILWPPATSLGAIHLIHPDWDHNHSAHSGASDLLPLAALEQIWRRLWLHHPNTNKFVGCDRSWYLAHDDCPCQLEVEIRNLSAYRPCGFGIGLGRFSRSSIRSSG